MTEPDSINNTVSSDVEMNQKMIDAGIEAYCLYDFGDPAEWVVTSIYAAMERAKNDTPQ